MKATGYMLASCPPQYPHKCDDCGEFHTVRGRSYPKIVYVEVNSDDSVS